MDDITTQLNCIKQVYATRLTHSISETCKNRRSRRALWLSCAHCFTLTLIAKYRFYSQNLFLFFISDEIACVRARHSLHLYVRNSSQVDHVLGVHPEVCFFFMFLLVGGLVGGGTPQCHLFSVLWPQRRHHESVSRRHVGKRHTHAHPDGHSADPGSAGVSFGWRKSCWRRRAKQPKDNFLSCWHDGSGRSK